MWRDGTSHLLFEPIERLEKLAAITPRPAINLVLYHGVLAPRARWRSQVVPSGRPAPDPQAHEVDARPRGTGTPGPWTWAALLRRVLALDVLACPRGSGRLRVIAAVQDPLAVQAIPRPPCPFGRPRVARPGPACPGRDRRDSPLDQTPRTLTLAAPLRPLRPRLDRKTAAAQDGSGRAGDRDADPRLRPLERAVPGLPPGFTGAAALAARPPPQHRWR